MTGKVSTETREDVNAGLDAGDLRGHDGTERLVRESSDAYDTHLFDD